MWFMDEGIIVVDNANLLIVVVDDGFYGGRNLLLWMIGIDWTTYLMEEELLSWMMGFMEGGIFIIDDGNLLNIIIKGWRIVVMDDGNKVICEASRYYHGWWKLIEQYI